MRTTLTIDDDVLALAQAVARARKVSTGKALSDLARRGHRAAIGTRRIGPFAVFAVSEGTPAIDPDAVRDAEIAEDEATYGGLLKCKSTCWTRTRCWRWPGRITPTTGVCTNGWWTSHNGDGPRAP